MHFKACSSCGRLHPRNYVCNKNRKHRNTVVRKLRGTYAWENKSLEVRAKANWLCEACKDQGIYTYDNLEVHHIEPLERSPEALLEDKNLICLCRTCHDWADNGKLSKEYLLRLAAAREK